MYKGNQKVKWICLQTRFFKDSGVAIQLHHCRAASSVRLSWSEII